MLCSNKITASAIPDLLTTIQYCFYNSNYLKFLPQIRHQLLDYINKYLLFDKDPVRRLEVIKLLQNVSSADCCTNCTEEVRWLKYFASWSRKPEDREISPVFQAPKK